MTAAESRPNQHTPGAAAPYAGAYIAHLWEQPRPCVALFGVQFHTPDGQQRWDSSGVSEEMYEALAAAQVDGLLLHNRSVSTTEGPVLMQYWRTHDDLAKWAPRMPHMCWWRWLLENAGSDLTFYHEIYQAEAAEAVYARGCLPVGPALFTATSAVEAGEGQSQQRQERFMDSARLLA